MCLFLFQESGSSFSPEAERAWLKNRHDKLKKTLRVLTSGPDRMLKCIETKNHSEFVYVNEILTYAGCVTIDTYMHLHKALMWS